MSLSLKNLFFSAILVFCSFLLVFNASALSTSSTGHINVQGVLNVSQNATYLKNVTVVESMCLSSTCITDFSEITGTDYSAAIASLASNDTAIIAILSNLSGNTTNLINAEASTRAAADSALSTRVDTVNASTISNAASIASLSSNDSTEASTRAAADSALSTRVDTVNASTISNAASISNLTGNTTNLINAEASTRASTDSLIVSNLSTESSTRASADSALSAGLANESGNRTNQVNQLNNNAAGWNNGSGTFINATLPLVVRILNTQSKTMELIQNNTVKIQFNTTWNTWSVINSYGELFFKQEDGSNRSVIFRGKDNMNRLEIKLDLNTTIINDTLIITGLTAANCDVKANTTGGLYCGTDATGGGGGTLTGSGTAGHVAIWANSTHLTDASSDPVIMNFTNISNVLGIDTDYDSFRFFKDVLTDGDIYIGNSEANHSICFYEDGSACGAEIRWDNDNNDRWLFNDAIASTGNIYADGTISSGSDIHTSGSGDDFWIGTTTQSSALVRAYTGGSMMATNFTLLNSTGGVRATIGIFSDTSTSITIPANLYIGANVQADADIFTTGTGDDLWLGTNTQTSARFQAYANGNLYMNGTLNNTGNASFGDVGAVLAPVTALYSVLNGKALCWGRSTSSYSCWVGHHGSPSYTELLDNNGVESIRIYNSASGDVAAGDVTFQHDVNIVEELNVTSTTYLGSDVTIEDTNFHMLNAAGSGIVINSTGTFIIG